MPGRDGTGPIGREDHVAGLGSQLGRGLGAGCKSGFRRNYMPNTTVTKTQKDLLIDQKEMLEAKIDVISKQIDQL